MSKFEFDDTNSTGIWWSTNVAIRDECIGLKKDTNCEDSEIVELLRSIAKNIEDFGLQFHIKLLFRKYICKYYAIIKSLISALNKKIFNKKQTVFYYLLLN